MIEHYDETAAERAATARERMALIAAAIQALEDRGDAAAITTAIEAVSNAAPTPADAAELLRERLFALAGQAPEAVSEVLAKLRATQPPRPHFCRRRSRKIRSRRPGWSPTGCRRTAWRS